MVKLCIFLIALCGLVLHTSAVELSFPLTPYAQQDGQQSGQQQKNAPAGAGQLPPCTPARPRNCGGKVTPPKVISAPSPKYTELARKENLSGVAVVSVIVGVDGKAHNTRIVRSISQGLDKKLQPAALSLDQKAVEAVEQYRFKPAMYQGKPVPVEVNIEVDFR